MTVEADQFWSQFEKETGEKVEARAIGEFYKEQDSSSGYWGLLILTDKSFRFKYVPEPKKPWMGEGMTPVEREDRTEFTVARGDIVSVSFPKRGFFARLTRGVFPRCCVVTRSESGEKNYVFSIDPSSGLIAALEKSWPVVAGTVVH